MQADKKLSTVISMFTNNSRNISVKFFYHVKFACENKLKMRSSLLGNEIKIVLSQRTSLPMWLFLCFSCNKLKWDWNQLLLVPRGGHTTSSDLITSWGKHTITTLSELNASGTVLIKVLTSKMAFSSSNGYYIKHENILLSHFRI